MRKKTFGFCLVILFWAQPVYAGFWSSGSFSEKEYRVKSVLDKDAMLVRSTVLHEFVNTAETQELEIGFDLPSGALLSKFEVQEKGKWISAKRVTQNVEKYFDSGRAKRGARTRLTAILFKEKSNNSFDIRVSPVASKKSLKVRYQVAVPIQYRNGKYFHQLLRYDAKMKLKHKTDYAYRFLGADKGPDEIHLITPDACSKIGAPHGCVVQEIDIPKSKEAHNWFLRVENVGKHRLQYRLVTPAGKRVSSGSFYDKKTEKELHFNKGFVFPAGIWKVILWTHAKEVTAVDLRIESDTENIEGTKSSFGAKQKVFNVYRSREPVVEILDAFSDVRQKSKLLYSQVRLRGKTFTKADFFAATPLSLLPKKPLMIFLLDTSISQGRFGVAAQLKIIRSIRENTNDEEAVVIVFNRKARVISDADKIDAQSFKIANGSNIDLAFALAENVAKKRAGKRPVFIYALGDFEFKRGINSETIAPLINDIPKSAVIHTIKHKTNKRRSTIFRSHGILSKLASQHNGFSALFDMPETPLSAKDTLHFVRPIRFDALEFEGLKNLSFVGEGVGINWNTWKSSPKKMEVHAKLWAKDFRLEAENNAALKERTVGYMLSEEKLSRREILTLSKRTKVVTVHNAFIIKGSAKREKPPEYGPESSPSSHFHSHTRSAIKRGVGFGLAALPPSRFSDMAKWCSFAFSPTQDISVEIETRGFEIVDVRTGTSGFEKCVADGIWKTHLKNNGQTLGSILYFTSHGQVSKFKRPTPKTGKILKQ